ncbi:unnamed protein product [Rhodiola kirilowii]
MHVEKNICYSLIGTLLNVPGKTKDGVKARLDMLDMNISYKISTRNPRAMYISASIMHHSF